MFQENVLDHKSLFFYIAVVKIRSDLTVCEVMCIDASDPHKQSSVHLLQACMERLVYIKYTVALWMLAALTRPDQVNMTW